MSFKTVVTSPSFSRNNELRQELLRYCPDAIFNLTGTMYEGENLCRYIHNADAIIVGLEIIDEIIILACPELKFIAKYGVGLDNIDLGACRRHGVNVGWAGGINRLSVAEMTLGFMLALSHNMLITSSQLKHGEWNKQGGSQLTGKTIGIIGVGNIGREVVRLLKPFACMILVNDVIDISSFCSANGLQCASKEEIFSTSDIVSIHTPLTDKTKFLVNHESLRLMKQTASIINTSRGCVVSQADLKVALSDGWIAGAALDVYEQEPPHDTDFLKLPNLICTPHIAGNAYEAVIAMGTSAINHIREYFKI